MKGAGRSSTGTGGLRWGRAAIDEDGDGRTMNRAMIKDRVGADVSIAGAAKTVKDIRKSIQKSMYN